MEDKPRSERALAFLRSDSQRVYGRKLDPAVKDHGITFERQRIVRR